MSGFEWRRVPSGLDPDRWAARGDSRTVLVMVQAIASERHLLDLIHLLVADPRIRVAVSAPPDAFGGGGVEWLPQLGAVPVPWSELGRHDFGLTIAGSCTALPWTSARSIVVTRRPVDRRRPASSPRARSQAVPCRACGPVPDDASPRSALAGRDGPVPDAIVLSHYAERARLVRAHPRVLPMALVAGDSSYDRLVASLPFRGLYRCAFGVGAGQRLVVAAPDPRSCRSHELPARLLAELPRDRYRVLAFLRSEESEGSRGSALTGRPRDGLSLAPAEADWRAALVAADWIVGDDAEVLPYAAITSTPVLLTLPSGDRADPGAGMAELARVAPRLSSRRRVRAQLCLAEEQYSPDRYRSVAERITSQPGLFNRNVRSLIYRLLGLRQPATIPAADPVSPPYRIESPSHETEKRRA